MRALVEEIVASVNRRVSSTEQIKKFVVLERDFSAERDEVTPTLKLKRDVVARNFRKVIEGLYEPGPAAAPAGPKAPDIV
jgi:long-chain acyl-CoA synthetase